jgi:hypothetical protein
MQKSQISFRIDIQPWQSKMKRKERKGEERTTGNARTRKTHVLLDTNVEILPAKPPPRLQ